MRLTGLKTLDRAHPRSRGENSSPLVPVSSHPGSSPLTRGKLHSRSVTVPVNRLIPAHAGKTRCSPTSRGTYTAHPRSRGENLACPTCGVARLGSSPLTRGKQSGHVSAPASGRLIPAHAGKTTEMVQSARFRRAHPRSRGENASASLSLLRVGGSSPLTRGKQGPCRAQPAHARLIPAHAGKTHVRVVHGATHRAHPRSRGENPKTRSDRLLDPGSSPLTRGKLAPLFCVVLDERLIPAHAGKTILAKTPLFTD